MTMAEGDALTERETQALSYLTEFITRNNFPPTRRQLAAALGCRSACTGQRLVRNLEAKGKLKVIGSPNRTLRIDLL